MGNFGMNFISFDKLFSTHEERHVGERQKKKKFARHWITIKISRYVRFQSSCRKWWHWTPELQLHRLRWKLPETNSPDEATTKKICRDFHIFSHARHKLNSAFSSATELMFDNSSPTIQLIKHRSFHLAFHSGLVVFLPRVMLSMNEKQREMCRWSHFQGGKIHSQSNGLKIVDFLYR